MIDSLGYKCCDPPVWLKITTSVPDWPEEQAAHRAEPIPWDDWIPWLEENIGKFSYLDIAGTIGCATCTVSYNIHRLFKAGKLHIPAIPARAYGKMTPEKLAILERELAAGKTHREIANILGVDITTVEYHKAKHGFEGSPANHPPIHGTRWSAQARIVIEGEMADGKGWTVRAATILGTYPGTVYRWMKQYQLVPQHVEQSA